MSLTFKIATIFAVIFVSNSVLGAIPPILPRSVGLRALVGNKEYFVGVAEKVRYH